MAEEEVAPSLRMRFDEGSRQRLPPAATKQRPQNQRSDTLQLRTVRCAHFDLCIVTEEHEHVKQLHHPISFKR